MLGAVVAASLSRTGAEEAQMAERILVAYASRYGTTAEVAAEIASTLRGRGLDVEVRPAGEVDDLRPYAAVVLGGGIYIGRWHRDARGFVKHFEEDLRRLPVAVFGLGPVTDAQADLAASEAQLERNLARLPVEPLAVGVFGGAFDPARARFPLNRMGGGDARDWDVIRGWAEDLAGRLLSVPAAAL